MMNNRHSNYISWQTEDRTFAKMTTTAIATESVREHGHDHGSRENREEKDDGNDDDCFTDEMKDTFADDEDGGHHVEYEQYGTRWTSSTVSTFPSATGTMNGSSHENGAGGGLSQEKYNMMMSMTLELVHDIVTIRTGDSVITPYGIGILIERRNEAGSMVIDFGFGKLYSRQSEMIHKVLTAQEYKQAMEFLEHVRKIQVELQCQQWNIPIVEGACVACLFDKPVTKAIHEEASTKRSRWFSSSRRRPAASTTTTSTRRQKKKKAPQVCDVCGNPVCGNHRISTAAGASDKEHFCMCVDCSFDLTQVQVQLDPNHPHLRQNVDRLLQYYTRMVVQLSFVVPKLRDIAAQLTTKERRNSHVALGTGGLSFVGAALGVVGTVALLTPVGHVMLLAAAATSASSAAIQGTHAGYNMMLSSREANQLADRALGWHGLCLGILDSLEQLRRDLLAQHIKSGYDDADLLQRLSGAKYLAKTSSNALEVWNALAAGGFLSARHGLTGVVSSFDVTLNFLVGFPRRM